MKKLIVSFSISLLLFLDSSCKNNKTVETFILPPVRIYSPYDIGKIEHGDTVCFSVSYLNTGDSDVQMDYVVTPCGCITAIPDTHPLVANDSSTVQIIYVPTKTGYVEENLFLHFKQYENPIHLQIKAKINRLQ
jgi:hypothetical protein